MFEKAITVTQFNNYIKNVFDSEVMLQGISIAGEITDWKISNNIAYFSVKDEFSMLSCVAFNASEKFADVKNGQQVAVTGSPNYYVKGGRFNFNVYKIENQGQGLLFMQFMQLKQKLEQEGLFDAKYKKPLPSHSSVKTIGVITSETGAVIEDIINVSTRRNPNINIVLYPAKVQGQGAAKTIIDGINYFETQPHIDAVIVARGGGSFEDLACFNDEQLARRVFATTKFVVSAVGHETDTTIIDFVSDLRAPTPSAAAELLTFDYTDISKQINSLKRNLFNAAQNMVSSKASLFNVLCQAFEHKASNFINKNINNIQMLKMLLINKAESLLSQKQQDVAHLQTKLLALNPQDVLKRGWAKIEQEGKALNFKTQLNYQNKIKITLQDGIFSALPQKQGE